MRVFHLLVFFTLLSLAVTAEPVHKRTGILLVKLTVEGNEVARAGEVVTFSEPEPWELLVHIDGKTASVMGGCVVPLDENFTPARAYLWMKQHPPARARAGTETHLERYQLCVALSERFPAHPLREELMALACDFHQTYERLSTMGKTNWKRTIAVQDRFLREYPRGANSDRIHFARFELRHSCYEYEGSIRLILEHIELYQEYLVAHPDSDVVDQVRSVLARLYRMAFECFPEGRVKEREWVRGKALKLYDDLLSSDDLEIRESARVAIFNLGEGRRTYHSSPRDW